MDEIDKQIQEWKESLCKQVDIGGLYSRNKIAHKWKAPFRALLLRETLLWRFVDLLEQAKLLLDRDHFLGSQVLIRSAIETLAVMVYLNNKIEKVTTGNYSFHEFSDQTSKLLLGSRNESTGLNSISILTILKNADTKYPGLYKKYEQLCELAHPNWHGLCYGYSHSDHDNFITYFSNRWKDEIPEGRNIAFEVFLDVFEAEYNEVWPIQFNKLEVWIEENNAELEATKDGGA